MPSPDLRDDCDSRLADYLPTSTEKPDYHWPEAHHCQRFTNNDLSVGSAVLLGKAFLFKMNI